MENRLPSSHHRQTQYSHSPPLHGHGPSLPPPLIHPHQHQYYAAATSSMRQSQGETPRSSNLSPASYNAPDLRYGRHHPSPQSSDGRAIGPTHEPMDYHRTRRMSPTNSHVSNPSMSTKRAYRQRRKDPSCDACRERKVKCDATETSSCSECLTRTVKCQFTKETNRRMSSIKQVQDLQTQLKEAMHQVSQLQRENHALRSSEGSPQPSHSKSTRIDFRLGTEQSLPSQTFEHVRRAIRTYSRGLFKEPPMYRELPQAPVLTTTEIKLPTKAVVDVLLSQFHDFYHLHRPFMQWRRFTEEVEKVYGSGSLKGMTQVWVGTFFVILACGTLQSTVKEEEGLDSDRGGIQYMIIASRLLNTWTDNLTLDHARTSLMISIFLNEQNVRSAGWIWLGSGVRILQDVGLHLTQGPWSKTEGDIRRMMFWSIFSYDRFLSLDGRPLQVYDDSQHDAEVPWPSGTADESSFPYDPTNTSLSATMPLIIPVVRCIPTLKRLLKSAKLSSDTLKTYDTHFHSIMTSYPDHLQSTLDTPLDPFWLHGVVPLLSARIILFRHNLGPHCTSSERYEAMNYCLRAAYHTVSYVRRCLDWTPSTTSAPAEIKDTMNALHQRIRLQADNFLCKHLWRTTLILAFRGEYEAVLICVRLMSIIGDMRKVNMSCGRNLSWFLGKLLARTRDGTYSIHSLDFDEELIAYASGDVQGDSENAWVWTGGEMQSTPLPSFSSPLPEAPKSATPSSSLTNNSSAQPVPTVQEDRPPLTALLTQKEMNDWGGWDRVESLLHELKQDHERQRTSTHGYQRSSHSSSKRVQMGSVQSVTRLAQGPTSAPALPTPPVGASRISIANII